FAGRDGVSNCLGIVARDHINQPESITVAAFGRLGGGVASRDGYRIPAIGFVFCGERVHVRKRRRPRVLERVGVGGDVVGIFGIITDVRHDRGWGTRGVKPVVRVIQATTPKLVSITNDTTSIRTLAMKSFAAVGRRSLGGSSY